MQVCYSCALRSVRSDIYSFHKIAQTFYINMSINMSIYINKAIIFSISTTCMYYILLYYTMSDVSCEVEVRFVYTPVE